MIKKDKADVSISCDSPSLITTGCKHRCRHLLFFSGVTEQPWTHVFYIIALIWNLKHALVLLPSIKKKLNRAELAVMKQIVDDWHLPMVTHTAFPGLHRQIYHFMMSVLLLDFVCCSYLWINREKIIFHWHKLHTCLTRMVKWKKRTLYILISIFFSAALWCVHPCDVVWGQHLRQSSLTGLSNEMDSAGAKA